ncbi:hypothetical protein Tco_1407911 [Tanacetum coccineum]
MDPSETQFTEREWPKIRLPPSFASQDVECSFFAKACDHLLPFMAEKDHKEKLKDVRRWLSYNESTKQETDNTSHYQDPQGSRRKKKEFFKPPSPSLSECIAKLRTKSEDEVENLIPPSHGALMLQLRIPLESRTNILKDVLSRNMQNLEGNSQRNTSREGFQFWSKYDQKPRHEQELQNRLKRLNERKFQIQECKVQEVKASDARVEDKDSSGIVSDTRNDQSLENQSNTSRDESNMSRNECNDKSTSGDDTNI